MHWLHLLFVGLDIDSLILLNLFLQFLTHLSQSSPFLSDILLDIADGLRLFLAQFTDLHYFVFGFIDLFEPEELSLQVLISHKLCLTLLVLYLDIWDVFASVTQFDHSFSPIFELVFEESGLKWDWIEVASVSLLLFASVSLEIGRILFGIVRMVWAVAEVATALGWHWCLHVIIKSYKVR